MRGRSKLVGWVMMVELVVACLATAEPAIRLREVSAAWGVEFQHHHGGSGRYYMVETMVGGVVVFDYDGDGDPDLFFVDGGSLPGYEGEPARSRLWRNDGPARFVEVTREAGVVSPDYGCGAVAGDVDADGDLDLYITAFGRNRLLINRGDGTFTDRSSAAGVDDGRWSMPASFADHDRDGDLDLYVVNYVQVHLDHHRTCGDAALGITDYCNPELFEPLTDRYYRNRGDGSFEDATAAAGLSAPPAAGLGVVSADLDGDGWIDLYVGNDLAPNFFFRNRGDGTFEDMSLLSGTAYSDRGRPEASMGIDAGDYDGDGDLDLVVANFDLETNALYRNTAQGLFLDGRFSAGLAQPSLQQLGFGILFADLDQDGWLDLLVANGHIAENAARLRQGSGYEQPNQLFKNRSAGRFQLLSDSGFDAGEPRVSRALASGDLDGDGDLDIVVVNSNQRATIFENITATSGGWLRVKLRSARGEPFAVGARVELSLQSPPAGSPSRLVREVRAGSSFLSHSEMTLHFGLGELGADQRLGSLRVAWPSGKVQRIEGLPAGRRVVLVERQDRSAALVGTQG